MTAFTWKVHLSGLSYKYYPGILTVEHVPSGRGISPRRNPSVLTYSGCMEPVRPLREVFDELIDAAPADRDAAALLRESGYSDLPDELLSEAIVSYAETASVEVAEHLAPFVTAHATPAAGEAPGTRPAPEDGLDLLASAPAPETGDGAPAAEPVPDIAFGAGSDKAGVDDLDFGAGEVASVAVPGTDLPGSDTIEPGTPTAGPTLGGPEATGEEPLGDAVITPFDDAPGAGSHRDQAAGAEGDAGI